MLLGGLWLARALTGKRQPGSLWMAVVAIVFCLLLALFDSPALLRWYPVLISSFMLVLFGSSLTFGPPIVERLARVREPQLPAEGIRYTRQVTVAWSVFSLQRFVCRRPDPLGAAELVDLVHRPDFLRLDRPDVCHRMAHTTKGTRPPMNWIKLEHLLLKAQPSAP